MELKIQNITKRYRDKTAVDDVSITLTPGVWGLLGANGAGKTTLMRMLAGILRPSSGRILCDGVEIGTLGAAYREKLGYLPQEFGFYPEFTVQDYLEYMAALKGLPRTEAARQIDALLERVSLTEVRRKKIIKLSGGMKRRVGIAQALLNDPEILILDEPTAGLDPGERVRFRNLLSEFAQERIVLISTHIVSDVEYIAAENAVMKAGKIIAQDTTEGLVKQIEAKVWQGNIPMEQLARWEYRLRVVNLRNEPDGTVTLRYLADAPQLPDSVPAQPRLEDLYLWLFPEEMEEANEPVSFGIETCVQNPYDSYSAGHCAGAGRGHGISAGDLYRLDGTGCQRKRSALHGSESNPETAGAAGIRYHHAGCHAGSTGSLSAGVPAT